MSAVVAYAVSEWERTMYYHGISPDPPELLYRSDFSENPFPIPKGKFPYVPTKTVHGVFNTPLNSAWHAVGPAIRDLLHACEIRYSAIMTARFRINGGENGMDALGPIVIWIATRPDTTTAENAHHASQDILVLLKANGVMDAVVEWFEGVIERFSNPQLLRVTNDTNPTYHVRRFLTPTLGMPIATAKAEGTASLFFHETQDRHGAPSAKVFGVSTCHVLREDTSVSDEYKDAGTHPQHVRLAGPDRFQRGLDDIRARINGLTAGMDLWAREIAALEKKPQSKDTEEAEEDADAVVARRERLAQAKKEIAVLEVFYKDIDSQWRVIAGRNIGHVDWAPKVSVDEPGRGYIKDIGTFEIDAARFKAHFKGNVVDLGDKFTPEQLTALFDPQSTGRTMFKFPTDRQLRINGWLTRDELAIPDCSDRHGDPCLIVMKNGNTTDLTVGRYAGLEAYLCDDLGVEFVALAIYNYDGQSGQFADKGDSGSLIFDGMGRMVGIIHSGMPGGGSNHITFAIPAWWAIEQLRIRYPHAEFNGTTF